MDDPSLMREWTSSPFRLELYERYEPSQWREDGKTPIGYRLYHDDQLIFESEDIAVPAGQTLDGDQTLRGVLGFLALRPGDVEADYFTGYTPVQLAWRDQHAEDLAGRLAAWDEDPVAGSD